MNEEEKKREVKMKGNVIKERKMCKSKTDEI